MVSATATKKQNLRQSTNKPPSADVIVLDSSDIEEEVPVKKRRRTSVPSTKAPVNIISDDEPAVTTKRKAKCTSAIVAKTATSASHDLPEDSAYGQAMWCDAYAPTTTSDLAPSKTRVQSVRNWLEEALYGRPGSVDPVISFSQLARDRIRKYRRILVLSGPAGVGKTTTLKVVANELGVEVVEWEEGAEEWSLTGNIGETFASLPFHDLFR